MIFPIFPYVVAYADKALLCWH